jgi:hypothetical protein
MKQSSHPILQLSLFDYYLFSFLFSIVSPIIDNIVLFRIIIMIDTTKFFILFNESILLLSNKETRRTIVLNVKIDMKTYEEESWNKISYERMIFKVNDIGLMLMVYALNH